MTPRNTKRQQGRDEMTNASIISGKFARVFTGNMTTGWLLEGDDLQGRANANVDPYWLPAGQDCPIYERNVDGHALALDGMPVVLYKSREAAEQALAGYQQRQAGRK